MMLLQGLISVEANFMLNTMAIFTQSCHFEVILSIAYVFGIHQEAIFPTLSIVYPDLFYKICTGYFIIAKMINILYNAEG